MHDELFSALCDSHGTVSWFAMSEAFQLADEIGQISADYPADKDGKKEDLVGLARRTSDFLRQRTDEAQKHANTLSQFLHRIQLGE